MTNPTIKLASCVLNETRGMTDALADRLADNLGETRIAVVEFRVKRKIEDIDADGDQIQLKVMQAEFADGEMAEHLRAAQRSIYLRRRPEQPRLDSMDDLEDDETETIRKGQAVISCTHCLHGKASDTITHAPEDADGDWCEWNECGHPVTAGTEVCEQHTPAGTTDLIDDPDRTTDRAGEPVHT